MHQTEVSGQFHCPTSLPPDKEHQCPLDRTASRPHRQIQMDVVLVRKIHILAGNWISIAQYITCCTTNTALVYLQMICQTSFISAALSFCLTFWLYFLRPKALHRQEYLQNNGVMNWQCSKFCSVLSHFMYIMAY